MEENREKNNKKIENEKRLEQDLRQMADDVILPDSLEPEAIQKMLQARQEEKQQGSKTKKNKKNWKRIVPIAAAACVCVIVGATVGIKQINKGNNKTLDAATIASAADQKETTQTLITAKDYKEIKNVSKSTISRWHGTTTVWPLECMKVHLHQTQHQQKVVMLVIPELIQIRISVRTAWGKPILSKPMEKTFIHCVGVL